MLKLSITCYLRLSDMTQSADACYRLLYKTDQSAFGKKYVGKFASVGAERGSKAEVSLIGLLSGVESA